MHLYTVVSRQKKHATFGEFSCFPSQKPNCWMESGSFRGGGGKLQFWVVLRPPGCVTKVTPPITSVATRPTGTTLGPVTRVFNAWDGSFIRRFASWAMPHISIQTQPRERASFTICSNPSAGGGSRSQIQKTSTKYNLLVTCRAVKRVHSDVLQVIVASVVMRL